MTTKVAGSRGTVEAATVAPRWVVCLAHAVPLCVLPSGLWRVGAWLAGPASWYHLDAGWFDGGMLYLLLLTALSEGCALLTLGLVRPWGERVPCWVPVLRGRPLPARAVVAVAASGAAAVALLCVYFFVNTYVLHLRFEPKIGADTGAVLPDHGPGRWLLVACYAPLLAWAPLLAVVTIAYHRRRTRGRVAAVA